MDKVKMGSYKSEFELFWEKLQFNTVRSAFNLMLYNHDQKIIERAENNKDFDISSLFALKNILDDLRSK